MSELPGQVSQTFDPSAWRDIPGAERLTDITYHRGVERLVDGSERDLPWVRIAFNRPEVRNAFRPETVDELLAAFDHVRLTPGVAVVLLCGNGPSPKDGGWAFSSGGDQRVRDRDGYRYAAVPPPVAHDADADAGIVSQPGQDSQIDPGLTDPGFTKPLADADAAIAGLTGPVGADGLTEGGSGALTDTAVLGAVLAPGDGVAFGQPPQPLPATHASAHGNYQVVTRHPSHAAPPTQAAVSSADRVDAPVDGQFGAADDVSYPPPLDPAAPVKSAPTGGAHAAGVVDEPGWPESPYPSETGAEAPVEGVAESSAGQAPLAPYTPSGRLHILEVQRLMRTMPQIVVAVVDGWAVGGGHSLQVVADLTIACREHGVFRQTDPDVASFDAGYGSALLARHVGQKRARQIFFLGESYTAEQAEAWGAVNEAVDHETIESRAIAIAATLAAKSPTSMRMLKFALNLADDGLAGQQVFAGEATRLAYATAEAAEGRDAFLERRPPNWDPFRGVI